MRYNLNLASQPFRRDRAMTTAAAVLSLLLAGVLGLQVFLIAQERAHKSELLDETSRTERQLAEADAAQAKLEATMRRSENADVLERSVFLNTLIARKGVSWTRLFRDLEGVLPFNMRLISVRPQANGRNEIRLDMVVGSQSGEPIVDLLTHLERSEAFSNPTVANSQPPSQSDPLYRYRVSVDYAQKF